MKKVEILWKKKSIFPSIDSWKYFSFLGFMYSFSNIYLSFSFTALSNKPSSIFSIFVSFSCDALIHFSSSVNEKDRYIFEKEYMNPKKEKYFHESMDGKIHSRVYEEIRTIVEEREDNTEEYDIEWEDDSREDDDLEYADAWDKNDNGIPDYAEDDR